VQLNEVVRGALDVLREQFQAHGVDLGAVLADDLPPVLANPFSLEEVVLHLLANGRDAVTDKGDPTGARVEVRTGRSADGTQVWLAVQDNGVGIPEGLQDQVFTPFYTTKHPERGTGLGMALSRSIVEQLGGHIELRSALDQGTTVTVFLPAAS
jgi:signal transduction histidine kinase